MYMWGMHMRMHTRLRHHNTGQFYDSFYHCNSCHDHYFSVNTAILVIFMILFKTVFPVMIIIFLSIPWFLSWSQFSRHNVSCHCHDPCQFQHFSGFFWYTWQHSYEGNGWINACKKEEYSHTHFFWCKAESADIRMGFISNVYLRTCMCFPTKMS